MNQKRQETNARLHAMKTNDWMPLREIIELALHAAHIKTDKDQTDTIVRVIRGNSEAIAYETGRFNPDYI